jgi:hypothetical protein
MRTQPFSTNAERLASQLPLMMWEMFQNFGVLWICPFDIRHVVPSIHMNLALFSDGVAFFGLAMFLLINCLGGLVYVFHGRLLLGTVSAGIIPILTIIILLVYAS